MRVKYCTAVSSRRISVITLPVRDARRLEARHLRHQSRRRVDERPRERGARSFTEPQAQVEQRLCLQMFEQLAMAVLRRTMTEDAVRANACVHFSCEQSGNAHCEAVDDHNAAMSSDFEHRASEHRELETAEFHQRLEWRQHARTACRGF